MMMCFSSTPSTALVNARTVRASCPVLLAHRWMQLRENAARKQRAPFGVENSDSNMERSRAANFASRSACARSMLCCVRFQGLLDYLYNFLRCSLEDIERLVSLEILLSVLPFFRGLNHHLHAGIFWIFKFHFSASIRFWIFGIIRWQSFLVGLDFVVDIPEGACMS